MGLTVEKCIQAWTNSLKQMKAKADIVFFGDSLTYYGDFYSLFPDKVVCNLGLRGDTIHGMINRVEQIKLLTPQRIYLMGGINDVSSCSPSQFKMSYNSLIATIRTMIPNADLIIQNLLPVNDKDFVISCNTKQIELYNEIIQESASHYSLCLIDLFSLYFSDGLLLKEMTVDGLHLKSDAYQLWMNALL